MIIPWSLGISSYNKWDPADLGQSSSVLEWNIKIYLKVSLVGQLSKLIRSRFLSLQAELCKFV